VGKVWSSQVDCKDKKVGPRFAELIYYIIIIIIIYNSIYFLFIWSQRSTSKRPLCIQYFGISWWIKPLKSSWHWCLNQLWNLLIFVYALWCLLCFYSYWFLLRDLTNKIFLITDIVYILNDFLFILLLNKGMCWIILKSTQ